MNFRRGSTSPPMRIENSLSAFMAAVVMSDILQGVGLLNGSLIWSYEQLIMDCEIFDIIHKMMQGIEVSS